VTLKIKNDKVLKRANHLCIMHSC